MRKHTQLKVVHVLSLFCFAIIVGCIVSIYSHGKTLRAKLDQKEQEFSTNSARARLASLETKAADLSDRLAESKNQNGELTEKLSQREQTIQAQKEDLKSAAEQIRKMSAPRK